jgi:alkanesulfonate monooxygenase SsuD/methylene tetrahydromethanopterin reductase-like flavin-dependent oxidoreductase (luciferase family)
VNLSLFLSADDPRLFLDVAREADRRGLEALWLPELEGSGLFPNPAVAASALAVATRRIALRAGGLSLPLHNPIRVAEEWSLVDNLSDGRAGIAFMPGDLNEVEIVRRLWRGEAERMPDGEGRPIDIRILPQPIQRELPLWLTDGRTAASLGANLFALDEREVALYRSGGGRHVTVVAPIGELERLEAIGVDEVAIPFRNRDDPWPMT